jgi:dimethylamine monooxygenase subunit C
MNLKHSKLIVKKILVLLEGAHAREHKAIIQKLSKETYMLEFFIVGENHKEDTYPTLSLQYSSINNVNNIFLRQLMGTTLYIVGEDSFIQQMIGHAYGAGFTDQEIQTCQLGMKMDKVFCVKCYQLLSKNQDEEVTCIHCQTKLQISNHFSKRHNAFLGYIKIG